MSCLLDGTNTSELTSRPRNRHPGLARPATDPGPETGDWEVGSAAQPSMDRGAISVAPHSCLRASFWRSAGSVSGAVALV